MRNISQTQTLNLSVVKFVNGITFQFPSAGATLAPGALIVITGATQSAFLALYPGAPYGGTYTGKLDNGGERVRMEIDGFQLGIPRLQLLRRMGLRKRTGAAPRSKS